MPDLDKSKLKKIFFIGIGGIGISALAKMAVAQGIEVAGLNDEDTPKTLEPLRTLGIEIFIGNDLSEIPEADAYVYSDAWLYRGPEIMRKAKATGKPVWSYFEALGLFAKNYKVIAIAGVHGKTTTTAMVAEILIDAGLDPTVIVGSFVKKFGSNFRAGKSKWLVVEADEYMRHFLNFHPYIGAVTNIEADHLDYYKDLADVESAFRQFLSQSERTITEYDRYLEQVPILLVPGEHNRKDAALALGIADMLEIPLDSARKSLAAFTGTWRRLEKIKETPSGVIVYDDYAHHPTEVKASLSALRELYPIGQKHITVVFQPHLYSRTKALFKEFVECWADADQVCLLPIYFAREDPDPTISSDKLAQAITKNGGKAQAFPDFDAAEAYLSAQNMGKADVLVTMGAGEAYKVAEKVFS